MSSKRHHDPDTTPHLKLHRTRPVSFWPDSSVVVRTNTKSSRRPLPTYYPLPSLDRGDADVVLVWPTNEFLPGPPTETVVVTGILPEDAQEMARLLRIELEDETGREVDTVRLIQEIVTKRHEARRAAQTGGTER